MYTPIKFKNIFHSAWTGRRACKAVRNELWTGLAIQFWKKKGLKVKHQNARKAQKNLQEQRKFAKKLQMSNSTGQKWWVNNHYLSLGNQWGAEDLGLNHVVFRMNRSSLTEYKREGNKIDCQWREILRILQGLGANKQISDDQSPI